VRGVPVGLAAGRASADLEGLSACLRRLTRSFSRASVMATTRHLWFLTTAEADQHKSAVIISGLGTFVAAYRYTRISNSWMKGCGCTDRLEGVAIGGDTAAPKLTDLLGKDARVSLSSLRNRLVKICLGLRGRLFR
jgi:hypothetical protein